MLRVRKQKAYVERKCLSRDRYKELLRFEEGSVEFFTNYFLPEAETFDRRGGALTPQRKMEIFLRYLSDPGFQSGVSLDFGVHRTSVSKTFDFFLNKIYEKAHEWIHFPQNNQ